MTIEAIVAIIALVVALPPTAFIICKWTRRWRWDFNKASELVDPTPISMGPNSMGRGKWSLTRSTTQRILTTTVDIRLEDGYMYQQLHAPNELPRFIRVLGLTENDEAVIG